MAGLMDGVGGAESMSKSLDRARRAAVQDMPAEEAAAFEAALDHLLAQTAGEEAVELAEAAEGRVDGTEFFNALRALWRFAQERRPGEVKLRRYCPSEEKAGFGPDTTVLEAVVDDRPFLLESLTALAAARGYDMRAALHPVVTVRRDALGKLQSMVGEPGAAPPPDPPQGASQEAWLQLQFQRIGDPAAWGKLEAAARRTLADINAAVADYPAMVARVRDTASELRNQSGAFLSPEGALAWSEAAEFLDWIGDGNFTLLGCRDYDVTAGGGAAAPHAAAPHGGLGQMRDPEFTVLRDASGAYADWTPALEAIHAGSEPLTILKANRRSTVRRTTHLDLLAVRRVGDDGTPRGHRLFAGLFTASAYRWSPARIPLLKGKLERILERSGFAPGGHDAQALANLLDTHPRDELLQASEDQLFDQTLGALRLRTRPRVRLFVRPDRFGRFMSCIIYAPRDRYDTAIRERMAEILCDAFNGRVADFTPFFGVDGQIRVHFVIAVRMGEPQNYDVARIEAQLAAVVRNWSDGFRAALLSASGPEQGSALHHRFAGAFPASYRESVSASEAAEDAARLDALTEADPIAAAFDPDADGAGLRFRLYRRGAAAPLSDVIPILENMGLRILEERPHHVTPPGGGEALFIHDFSTERLEGGGGDMQGRRAGMEAGFVEIWRGGAEDDRLNRLLIDPGLSARQIAVLRAYCRFLRQAGVAYSLGYMEDALTQHPELARLLSDLFGALFDPNLGDDATAREARAGEIVAAIDDGLEQVARLDFDRIIRRLRNAIEATRRTNLFQPGADGAPKPYFSFKFECDALEELPEPRPWREIFVYSPAVEGCHLRGGPVARGGLRWSDRREDFRTEVLGLVKAQQVKNSVIVPVGSKGGFFPKQLPAPGDREAVRAAAIEAYKTFLRGLLDITDNLVDGAPTPPDSVVRRDDDDPYLVVAADKGTATFSDIANEVAAEYGFWLGDAFASGGGEGYDHKAMGITARGAWEAVKRHFRELGHDTQTEPFAVIGVGDMSGDVFGNGMLLSEHIRLLAAFDHRDIFIDPDPDPARSFAERKRLFELPRSSWGDYDTALISKGGGVFSRSLKSIPLTDEIRALTGLATPAATPFELIRALLGAKTDLLWFGGIGTYIRAAEESDDEVGDRANDAVRVSADAVRARVVGEGANLGVTQRGRIALSHGGTRINTDAVDNAGGVDCSDHEVNIKIALGAAEAAGALTREDRNTLLRDMTDEVADLVLSSNYAQTGAISVIEAKAPARLDRHQRFMRAEEAADRLDRAVEALPDDEEIAARAKAGRGLTRPELAVLVAYAKIGMQKALIDSDLPDDPYLERWLIDYFPAPMRARFASQIKQHRLRRELIATVVADAFVNEGGPSLAIRLKEETGAAEPDAAKAFLIVRELFGLGGLGAEIDALDNKVAAEAQIAMRLRLQDALSGQCLSLLQRGDLGSVSDALERYGDGVAEVAYGVGSLLSAYSRDRLDQAAEALREAGAPSELAQSVASFEFLGGAMDVVTTAQRLERGVIETAATYFAAGARFGLDWLRISAWDVTPSDDWERIAIGRLVADLRAQQSAIAASALSNGAVGSCGGGCVDAWADAHATLVARADRVFAELRSDGELSVAKLAVASSQLRGWE